jgi:hypothetical protein
MGAKKNFVVCGNETKTSFRRMFGLLEPIISEQIGSLCQRMTLDWKTGTHIDEAVGHEAKDYVPEVTADKIVVFYSHEPGLGCLTLVFDTPFIFLTLSLPGHVDVLSVTHNIWLQVGLEAEAVLSGEELVADSERLLELIMDMDIPRGLDLCEIAIVKSRERNRKDKACELLMHKGVLLLPRHNPCSG